MNELNRDELLNLERIQSKKRILKFKKMQFANRFRPKQNAIVSAFLDLVLDSKQLK